MLDYYDWILFVITAILLAGWVFGFATAVPLRLALSGSALAASPFVYDALFRNPPTASKHRRSTGVGTDDQPRPRRMASGA